MLNRILVLGLMLQTVSGARVRVTPENIDSAQPEVSVRLFDADDVSRMTLSQARTVTTKILASAGVRIRWAVSSAPASDLQKAACETTGAAEAIDIRFAYSVSPVYKPEAFPFAKCGVLITVFFDRVSRLFEARLAPDSYILGHVLAHEIGHVLLKLESHAGTGLMKAHWTNHDFMDMRSKFFTFTPQSIALIQSNLAKREDALLLAAPAF